MVTFKMYCYFYNKDQCKPLPWSRKNIQLLERGHVYLKILGIWNNTNNANNMLPQKHSPKNADQKIYLSNK